MKKLVPVLVVGALVFLGGCGSILIRPAVDKVKKVALISVYMNREFYDVKAPKASEGAAALKTLGRATAKATGVMDMLDNAFAEKQKMIVSYAVKAYSEQLNDVGDWEWLPVSSVLQSSVYKNFVNLTARENPAGALVKVGSVLASANYFVAPNMIHIPIESVAQSGTHVYAGDAKDPKENMRKALIKLCKDLKVDAVAIVELDMGYKKPMMSLKLIGDDPAIPNISSALVVVNKDGELAVKTALISKGQGTRFEGDKVGLLRKNAIHLTDKGVNAYCQAIDRSAVDMKKKIAEAFKKIGPRQ